MADIETRVIELLAAYRVEHAFLAEELTLHKGKLSKVHQTDLGPVYKVIGRIEAQEEAIRQIISRLEGVLA